MINLLGPWQVFEDMFMPINFLYMKNLIYFFVLVLTLLSCSNNNSQISAPKAEVEAKIEESTPKVDTVTNAVIRTNIVYIDRIFAEGLQNIIMKRVAVKQILFSNGDIISIKEPTDAICLIAKGDTVSFIKKNIRISPNLEGYNYASEQEILDKDAFYSSNDIINIVYVE